MLRFHCDLLDPYKEVHARRVRPLLYLLFLPEGTTDFILDTK